MANGLLTTVRRPVVFIPVLIAILAGSFLLWWHFQSRESTDDAQVTGHVNPVAPRVGGTVTAIHIADNQAVKAGDVLIEIDPRDYQLAVQKAEADLAGAQSAERAARADVPITSTTSKSGVTSAEAGTSNAKAAVLAADREADAARAKVESAKARKAEAVANATRAAQDLARLKPLVEKDEISKQQFDAAMNADTSARAAVESAQAAITEAEANLQVSEARRVQSSGALSQAEAQAKTAGTAPQQIALIEAKAASAAAEVQQAEAALGQARLNLERTIVRAPADGVVSKRSVEVGQLIQAGQPIMAITSLGDVWVTANFKETQLRDIKTGQPAEVSVDAYGGRTFRARVDSLSAATGATFSLLPPDNASGNFVKVVQRVPVKIVLEGGQDTAAVLRPGMSVTATIFVR